MLVNKLKCKLHRAKVTQAKLNYEGSISIDKTLCKRAGLLNYEKVDIYNITNGARFSTYVIFGKKGEICLNGAAARHVQIGDRIIIAAYCQLTPQETETFNPKFIFLDSKNRIK